MGVTLIAIAPTRSCNSDRVPDYCYCTLDRFPSDPKNIQYTCKSFKSPEDDRPHRVQDTVKFDVEIEHRKEWKIPREAHDALIF